MGDNAKAAEMFEKAAEVVTQDQDEKIEFSALEKTGCLECFEEMAAAVRQTDWESRSPKARPLAGAAALEEGR